MGILKKFFGKPQKVEDVKPKNPRYARVQVTALHRISFEHNGVKAELRNISFGGMALFADTATPEWRSGHILSGRLSIDSAHYEIKATIRHFGNNVVGCEFFESSLELKRAIEAYLRVEILALNLRAVNEGFLKPDPRGKVAWFTDSGENELYCVFGSQDVVAFHMMFLGHYVEFNHEHGIRVGSIRPDSGEVPNHKGSDLLDLSSELAREKVNLARIFIQNLKQMPDGLREQVDRCLSQSI